MPKAFDIDLNIQMLTDPSTFLGALALGLAFLLLAWFASWLLGLIMRRWEPTLKKIFFGIDETIWRFLVRIKSLFVFLIALFIFASVVPSLRAFLGTLVAGAGITAIFIGFAAKSTLANLVSGVALAIYRPIHIGDIVTIENEYGTIEDITLRHTILLTWDKKRLVIPNEKLDNLTIINYSMTDRRIRQPINLGVSYDTDIDLARHLILDEARKCPHRIPDRDAPDPPLVRVVDWEDFSITLRLYLWCPSMDQAWYARFWIMEHVKKRFDREGVEIPFPYRTLVFKKDLAEARKAPPEILEAEGAKLPGQASNLDQKQSLAEPGGGPGSKHHSRKLSHLLDRLRHKNKADPKDK